jgi:hypothetical protein
MKLSSQMQLDWSAVTLMLLQLLRSTWPLEQAAARVGQAGASMVRERLATGGVVKLGNSVCSSVLKSLQTLSNNSKMPS